MALPTTPNPWLPENWSITAQAAYTRLYGLVIAQQAAKAAGSAVGALSPKGEAPFQGKTYILTKRVYQNVGGGAASGGAGYSGDGPPVDSELS